ncbi:hypothetical protein HKX54_13795 [Sulfitobacter sp. M57]|uniref:hypothetical protein n=1 Tax=unclassified Sulfitobacter TaxID=196795 RepID=UPI0023E1045D|nr:MULTISPECIES: hypothetical protein [unclassified Sulfitobacter]MDF3415538.1 hypothetical protein [Sulfitobacter sp. KE5]MDF3423019.1 hypothetical protein [Sulfitobacter sp. KE43]MDF3434084.1 hypothetical protein [Sulfitobacter sp. KE42]MDF3459883.1 hypothetical protein [Sulfitobacter sp. S74]MDF3463623.1 hypothetical protein [Sulfitobacter sp. Ks18]
MDRLTADGISWTPSRRVFLRRVGITAVLTFLGLSAIIFAYSFYFTLPDVWIFPSAGVLTLGFVIEDLLRWRNLRNDLWQISEGQLIYDGPDGRAQIPLGEIDSAKVQFGTRVVVKLASGQRILMRYLPYAADTADQIDAARGPRRP